MGRWAQQRRRGGGGGAPPPPAPSVNITSIASIGVNSFRLAFDAVVTYDGSGNLTGLTIDGDAIASVLDPAGPVSTLDVTCGVADGPGLPWLLSSSPPESAELWTVPQSGVTI